MPEYTEGGYVTRDYRSVVLERSITECRHCGNDVGMCCAPTIAYYETQRYRLNATMTAALDKAQQQD